MTFTIRHHPSQSSLSLGKFFFFFFSWLTSVLFFTSLGRATARGNSLPASTQPSILKWKEAGTQKGKNRTTYVVLASDWVVHIPYCHASPTTHAQTHTQRDGNQQGMSLSPFIPLWGELQCLFRLVRRFPEGEREEGSQGQQGKAKSWQWCRHR